MQGITDAELSSALANLLARQMDTMVRLIVDRDVAAAEIHLTGVLHARDVDMLQKQAHELQSTIDKRTVERDLLRLKLSFFDGDVKSHIDSMLDYNLRVYKQVKKANEDLAAMQERLVQSELRSQNFEDLLKKWMYEVDDTYDAIGREELIAETKAALAAAEEQGLERNELPTEGSTVGERQSSTPHARSHSGYAS